MEDQQAGFGVSWINHAVTHAPEIFIFLAMAIGTLLGRIRIRGFALGAVACTLIVAVVIGQLGPFVIPSMLKAIFFGLFVFTIGYRSGPEFFASLSFATLAQVALALVMGGSGLVVILAFAFTMHLDPGTAAGLGAGALTQSSMLGTAAGALQQLELPLDRQSLWQANIAAGYAVTYVGGYILVLLFVPLVAPWLMGVDLRQEATKLEAALSAEGTPRPRNLLYRKFQARAFEVKAAAGSTVLEIEERVGRRAVIERILRSGGNVAVTPETRLQTGDEILLVGPSHGVVGATLVIGPEIEGEHVMGSLAGEAVDVLVTARALHGRTLGQIVDRFGDAVRGVYLRSLMRRGQEVPLGPSTRIYVGDIMTIVAVARDLAHIVPRIGQRIGPDDRTDMAFLAGGLAVGLLVGLLSFSLGSIPLTLGGGGGALVAGLVCGWLRSRNPTRGAFPAAAQTALIDLGLGGFVAAIGLASGPAALAAIQANGATLLWVGAIVTLTPLLVGTLFAHRVLRMNPVIVCGALAGAMTVDAAVNGACEVANSQTPVLGVAVPYAVANVFLTVLGPIIVGLTFTN